MASINTRVDDVLYSQKDQIVKADGVAKVKVPGMVTGKARGNETLTFDVKKDGPGEKELRRLEAAAHKATREAWAPILAIKGRTPVDPEAPSQAAPKVTEETLDVEDITASMGAQQEESSEPQDVPGI